jgi:hypothetical protein
MANDSHGFYIAEQCNLPAPDSFRITQTGGEFIKLAWKPIFPGATHQLIIMESDGAGGYVTILEENNVPGDTYIADDLLPGTGYRFVLATKCSSGDPSEIKTIFDGITLIVDLTILGRKPALKGTSGDCDFIPINYNWIGFEISGVEEEQYFENFFEIVPVSAPSTNSNFYSKIQIKRYGLNDPIVAVKDPNSSPNCIVPLIENVPPRFRIDRLINGGPNKDIIGYVDLTQYTDPPSFGVCPDYTDPIYPWKTNFNLIPIFSPKAIPPQKCNEPRDIILDVNSKQILINNPFFDQLMIRKNSNFQEEDVNITIFDYCGRTYFSQKIEKWSDTIIINTESIPNGVFIINLQGNLGVYRQTIIKI